MREGDHSCTSFVAACGKSFRKTAGFIEGRLWKNGEGQGGQEETLIGMWSAILQGCPRR